MCSVIYSAHKADLAEEMGFPVVDEITQQNELFGGIFTKPERKKAYLVTFGSCYNRYKKKARLMAQNRFASVDVVSSYTKWAMDRGIEKERNPAARFWVCEDEHRYSYWNGSTRNVSHRQN